MNGPIEPFRPARLTVRRAPSWWPFSVVLVLIDGRRLGYVASGKAKTFRLSGGERVASVVSGSARADLPIFLSEGEALGLICGERPPSSARVLQVLVWMALGVGSWLGGWLVMAVLPPLRGPMYSLWFRVASDLGGGSLIPGLIRMATSRPGAFLVGVWASCSVARSLADRLLVKVYPKLAEPVPSPLFLVRETDVAFVKKAAKAYQFDEV
jgi:hypothetical protein